MKIGILTFHRAINYGAVLQCYALYQTLCMRGHDVEVIDYRPNYIEKYRNLFSLPKTKNPFSFIKTLIRAILLQSEKKKAVENFNEFLSLFKISSIVENAEEINNLKYDIIIAGSDQIWNKNITNKKYDDIFWGHFNHPHTKFVSYAASFGKLDVSIVDNKTLKGLLSNIDSIGVREEDFATYLEQLGYEAHVCVDPTVLASKQIFLDLAILPEEEGYILVYALKDRSKAVAWAKKIQQKTQKKIIVLGGNVSCEKKYGENIKIIQGLSPRLFLGYFLNASIIVNASFHGTVFSTLFEKEFYSLDVDNSGRYRQYLEAVDLSDRFVEFGKAPSLLPVNYSGFDEKKAGFVKKSEDYLCTLNI